MKKALAIIIPIIICFLIGITASYFQAESLQTWYPTLTKPSITPPNAAFPIAWSIIYFCMGISVGLIINSNAQKKMLLITLFVIQLFFNFTWSFSFFYLQSPLLGFINMILLDIAVVTYAFKSYSVKRASAFLFTPYILWLCLATFLNTFILIYN